MKYLRIILIIVFCLIVIGWGYDVFADGYIWYGNQGTGYSMASIVVMEDKIEEICGTGWVGCYKEYQGTITIYVYDVHSFDERGCTIPDHEWWHLMGYSEYEITRCNPF